MNFVTVTPSDALWERVIRFAQDCSGRAGKSLAKEMSENLLTDWKRVILDLHALYWLRVRG